MKYDPIKKSLGKVFNKNPFLRKIFYKLLDLLLLRAWFVKRELKLFSKDKSVDLNILDAGAGFGQYTYFISTLDKSWNIKAVDVKQEQIDDCNRFFTNIKKQEKVKFEFADLTKFTEENKYDLILSVDVMEHIEDDIQVFKNFNTSMKPGATLLISTPSDKAEDHHEHDNEEGDEKHFFVEEHVREGYNIDEIKNKLTEAGFTNITAKYSYGKPGTFAWILSMKIPIIVLNFSKLFFILLPFYYIIVYPLAFILNFIDLNGKHKSGRGLVVKAQK
jgi:SAM-dependent methyltransferase